MHRSNGALHDRPWSTPCSPPEFVVFLTRTHIDEDSLEDIEGALREGKDHYMVKLRGFGTGEDRSLLKTMIWKIRETSAESW